MVGGYARSRCGKPLKRKKAPSTLGAFYISAEE